jgi:hypothetical protein
VTNLTADEARTFMSERGYRWVRTAGGPVPLAEWRPYGGYEGWRGRPIADNAILDDVPESERPAAAGIWRFTKNAGRTKP